MLSGSDEITRLNSDVTTTMNLPVVSNRDFNVLTYTNNPCRFTKLYTFLFYHVSSAVTGSAKNRKLKLWYMYIYNNKNSNCLLKNFGNIFGNIIILEI